ncbi:hypothetical protein XBJ2_1290005 [Xenorhabdus bovienii str. Jollieti]|uniref:Uncharacterized protein n=1 Tax=Xenorhabdus bovienii (strain SS-2004) TaxID=406818 RepID=D3V1I1_XENBS|nr:hypothetical protein [Xenorhabdus bovienii]CBJ81525.1 hypothetical protein XBJ1_2399 [Xenorhabdus bovienii SS-2004]CDH27298.1 hypothetical protein XBJ2_1290005 [Xenorhabdus bovienii str. Jollieti]
MLSTYYNFDKFPADNYLKEKQEIVEWWERKLLSLQGRNLPLRWDITPCGNRGDFLYIRGKYFTFFDGIHHINHFPDFSWIGQRAWTDCHRFLAS